MRQQIIVAHREALDQMETAKYAYHNCRRKGQCEGGKNCITCPSALNYQAKQAVFDERSAALKEVNEQTIKQNDRSMTVEKEKRMKEREKRKMGRKEERIYNRDELTVERYKEHRQEKMKDHEISRLYKFPKSSFEKWKRDNNLTQAYKPQKAAKLVPKKEADSKEEVAYKQQYEQAKLQYDELLEQHLKLQQELEAANLEKDKKQKVLKLTDRELQEVNETLSIIREEIGRVTSERDHYKEQAELHAGTVDELREQIRTLNDESDNETMEAVERQFQLFDQWETMMMQRMLQLKKAN